MRFLDLLEVNGLFIKADLGVTHSYLVALLVFLQEFLKVRPRVPHLLLARVEDYLPHYISTTFWLLIYLFKFII